MAIGDLRTACERALFEAARAERAGSRQEVRAAARRFVKRHRRESGYLRWVLRSVAASSALAVALLGIGTETASADATLFEARTGADNPLDGQDVGDVSGPTLGDLDGDGDLDLVAGANDGTFRYYENTGSATNPAFSLRTGAENPLNGADVGSLSVPTLGDLDGDGDLDLFVGEYDGVFNYFENTGSALSAAFIQRSGGTNPLNGIDIGFESAPTLGDLDGDGDLDLVTGGTAGNFRYWENTGTPLSPAFTLRTGAENPLNGADVGNRSAPTLGDLDGDGDLDLITGEFYGTFLYYENTGSTASPTFVERTGAENPLNGADVGNRSALTLGDLDGDGDLDLITGEFYGNCRYYENLSGDLIEQTGAANPLDGQSADMEPKPTFGDLDGDGAPDLVSGSTLGTFQFFLNTGSANDPVFVEQTGLDNPLDSESVTVSSAPTLGDLDNDGDLDLISGRYDGTFRYYENTGTPLSPAFTLRTGTTNPLNGRNVGSSSTPTLGDLDGDGDLDLIAGESDGLLNYYENTGTAASPLFTQQFGLDDPVNGLNVGQDSTPTLADVDGDGDLDLFVGEYDGFFSYFENTGTPQSPVFVERVGTANPLDGEDVGFDSAPALVDLDGDGDPDLVSGEQLGSFLFYENTILRPTPSTFELIGPANPLDGESGGIHASTTLGDLDGDGDLDLITGNFYGNFRYYENIGTALAADFIQRSGGANPLNGVDIGYDSAPTLGDLDGDGDLDLVVGESTGQFNYFENTGTATAPVFTQQFGGDDPLIGQDIGDDSTPSLGDFDGDGDLDLLVGEYTGVFNYFENTGTATSPVFTQVFGAANPLDGEDVGFNSAPTLDDLDGDGDLDVVAGANDGTFRYYENTGTTTSPVFVQRTGADNPLDGRNAGTNATPALGNLDGDGDPDLVVGSNDGTFRTYAVPEPGAGLLLGAGLAWLRGLARLRRGRGRASADER